MQNSFIQTSDAPGKGKREGIKEKGRKKKRKIGRGNDYPREGKGKGK